MIHDIKLIIDDGEVTQPFMAKAQHLLKDEGTIELTCFMLNTPFSPVYIKVYASEQYLVSSACISELPGDSSVLVFSDVVVNLRYQGRGLGKIFHEMRLELAKAVKARAVIATVNPGNRAERAIMARFNWRPTGLTPTSDLWIKSFTEELAAPIYALSN